MSPEALQTIRSLWQTYWPVGAVALVLTAVFTPICRLVALRLNIVDRPDAWLKPHGRPMPYLGGVAIFIGWAAGLIVGTLAGKIAPITTVHILLAAAGITLLGLFDDMRMLPPKIKLAGNIAVALWIVLVAGVGDEWILIVRAVGVQFSEGEQWLILSYSVPLAVFIIVGACNATNLIDGLDGLCSGVLGLISLGFLVLALFAAVAGSARPADDLRIVLSLAMLGAAFGFLPYNVNPAKIFMGDAGSMLLGLNAAIIMLLFADEQNFRFLLGAFMVFGLPVGDMLLTLARRWRNFRPIMQGDRSHFYDQLVDQGLTVPQVVRISYILTLIFVVMGCLALILRVRYLIPLYTLFVLLMIALAAWRDMFHRDEPGPAPTARP